MAVIKEFKAVLYNKKRVSDLSKVVSPPYDVISKKLQGALYKNSPYNFVRIDFGKPSRFDTNKNNRFTRAANFFKEWLNRGILKEDAPSSIYIYIQKFCYKKSLKERIGFIANFKLESPGKSKILPHEKTFHKPKLDRLNLVKMVSANTSPIFSIFDDADNSVLESLKAVIKRKTPLVKIDFDNCMHALYGIDDRKFIGYLKKKMQPKKIYIADGHHRYEVAIAFREMMIKNKMHKSSYDYVMMYFAPIQQGGNTILATHRAIKDISCGGFEKVLEKLKAFFTIKHFKNQKSLLNALEKKGGNKFGIYFGKNLYYLLLLKDTAVLDKLIKENRSSEWKRLDVSILHSFVLKNILKFKGLGEDKIIYSRDPGLISECVARGECKIGFFLKATRVDQIKRIAHLGEKMPHKATYFYPKLLSGLVINKF